ncbi:cytochrome P450 87A3-like [Actinidia eriantha]|uniref:cytochrome P450 87A3-like n=1 Tax=Actinidia eriantha TaxID=165200 RepID=UPI0025867F72|nr:cytochrome P450 87A3-like [Actinidia eriantha]
MWLVLCLIALLVIWITHWVHKWGNPKCNGKLPPGSMGLPIIGESIQYFSPYTEFDTPTFIKERTKRYGSLFRTSLVGKPIVVSTDPEINHYIFQQEGRYFQCYYTESFTKILGDQNSMLAYHGVFHKYLKNLILKLTGRENLKGKLIHEMDANTCRCLHSWTSHESVNVKEAISEMIFEYSAKHLFGCVDKEGLKKLRENYIAFSDGLISFPLNVPGTAYHACMQGRKNTIKVIKNVFKERKSSQAQHSDFLDHLLEEVKKKETFLSEEIAVDLVFLLLFATYETLSTTVTLATKFIADHPLVLAELTKEQEAILRRRGNEESEITWEEYRSMTFTHMVINEIVRLGNIAPMILRKVTKDVELKGYTVPSGWLVMVSTLSTHLDPTMHEDPLSFNPWRWEGQELHAGSKNFMAFGGGVRLCVGAEFAKLQTAIFIHHLVTKYRWEITGGGDTIRRPSVTFPKGLYIQMSTKTR